jgi:hypothetical protein
MSYDVGIGLLAAVGARLSDNFRLEGTAVSQFDQ